MIKTTVIGLGAMGAGMAGNLHRAGMLAGAWNRSRQRGEAASQAHGFELADDLAAATRDAELIITCVSADADLFEVIEQLLPLLPAGQVVLDTSTVSSDTAQRVANACEAQGVHFIDGPVSGGREGAEKGSMVMMAGGDAQVLQQVMPALKVITSRVVHMGPVGSGQATKAVNQIMAAGINQAVTEALAFGQASGLDMEKVIDVVGGGAAGNWFLDHRGKSMCSGTFEPGFRVALHHKDLKICQGMAAKHDVKLPVVEMTLVHYERLMEQTHGDEDISALFRLKKQLFDN
jgi:3-hydroxyisobutyrate dehydrogenase